MHAGRLLDLLRRLSCFGLGLMKMDLRQESSRHTDALAAVTKCALCHIPSFAAAAQASLFAMWCQKWKIQF